RPAFLGSRRVSAFSGSLRVISSKEETLAPRRPGVVGLYLRIGMAGYGPFASKISMASPSARVTTACLWSGRLPLAYRVRLGLPLRISVFTFRTRTFQICWIASLISVLFVSG